MVMGQTFDTSAHYHVSTNAITVYVKSEVQKTIKTLKIPTETIYVHNYYVHYIYCIIIRVTLVFFS